MNMVRHQAVAEHLQLINLLPILKVCQVVLEITAFDEHRLAVMAALNNMMGKTGHNHPGLSWGISTSLLLNHRIRSVGRQPILTEC